MFPILVILILSLIMNIICLVFFASFCLERYRASTKKMSTLVGTADDAVMITGCDSGIGLELARCFYKSCKCKVICGLLNTAGSEGHEELRRIKTETDSTDRLILTKLDVTLKDDINDLKDNIKKWREERRFRNLIALINNAGVMTYGEFDWLTDEQKVKQIDVNLKGPTILTGSLLPLIIECKGRIINVSSVNDTTVFPGLSIYSATKSALSMFSRVLGYELRKFGVRVITIRLGDFARLTNIMSHHKTHQDAMWDQMTSEKKLMYKDYFPEFNGHLMKNYGMTSPRGFEDSSLFSDFRLAVFAENPPTIITCAPLTFRIIYFFIELMPITIQNHLLDVLIRFGFNWDPPEILVKSKVL